MSDQTEECWTCGGTGVLLFAIVPGSIGCMRCNDTGRCPSIMREWEKAGRALQEERRARRIDQRALAKSLGVLPSQVSQAEMGIIDPATIGYSAKVFHEKEGKLTSSHRDRSAWDESDTHAQASRPEAG